MSKRKIDDDSPAPRARAPKKRNKRGRSHLRLGRLVYWGAVLGLWAVIAVAGVVIWVGAHLPPIQSLEIPKRPPTIQIVGVDGTVLATRGEQAGTKVNSWCVLATSIIRCPTISSRGIRWRGGKIRA